MGQNNSKWVKTSLNKSIWVNTSVFSQNGSNTSQMGHKQVKWVKRGQNGSKSLRSRSQPCVAEKNRPLPINNGPWPSKIDRDRETWTMAREWPALKLACPVT